MALEFAMADAIRQHLNSDSESLSDKVIVQLDAQQRASFVALDQQQGLQDRQLRLQFRWRNSEVKFATNAFFFQEGTGAIYEQAKYGLFRVDHTGNLLLTHLVDAQLQILGQTQALQPASLK